MSWYWGKRSKRVRDELHSDLILVVDHVLLRSPFDLTLTEGYRGVRDQTAYFEAGLSELRFPFSQHNRMPAHAVHIHPYPVTFEVVDEDNEWLARYHVLAGLMVCASGDLGIGLRWLGLTSLRDYAHWELPK